MKKFYSLLFTIISFSTFAQLPWCGTEEYFRRKAESNPDLYNQRAEFFSRWKDKASANEEGRSVPRIIPVVFHVIHQDGTENISKAQIIDQLRILNEDFRKLNDDTVNIPAPHKPLAVDCNIEFRLAQKDPNGNCTDGIIRIYSTLTNNAQDAVKALSDWPRNKYFNIWVVKSVASTPPYVTLGYAAPPPPFSTPEEDGVVIRADYVGTIGTSSPAKAGRVLTHETGHWLGLQHIWGDANCGDDGVNDTPVHEDVNFNCPSFPQINTCPANDPINGEMFTNYMDYTDGDCKNMFSSGQKTERMDLVLGNALSRASLVTASNNVATGTDGTPAVLCSPIADFVTVTPNVCEGSTVTFVNFSYNADSMSYSWQFPGGNPASSILTNPSVQYSTAGMYSVTLTATNAAGSSTKTRTSYIVVSGAALLSVPYTNGFESSNDFPSYDGYVVNADGGNTWQRYTGAGSNGTSSIRLNIFSGNTAGQIDEYILPSLNFTYITQDTLLFKTAHAQRNSTSDDGLKVFVSTNCGQTWAQRMYFHGATLASAPVTATDFVPNSSQWVQRTVLLTAYAGMPNIRIKFQGISDEGNNIYVDDINITGIVGIEENDFEISSFNVYPNPSSGKFSISFDVARETEGEIIFTDMVGKTILAMGKNKYHRGLNTIEVGSKLNRGVYLVQIKTGSFVQAKRLVVIEN